MSFHEGAYQLSQNAEKLDTAGLRELLTSIQVAQLVCARSVSRLEDECHAQ